MRKAYIKEKKIMNNSVRDRIHKIVDAIQDEKALAQVMQDVTFYSSKEDIVNGLNESQLQELEAAMKEADNNLVISMSDFKNQLDEWRKK